MTAWHNFLTGWHLPEKMVMLIPLLMLTILLADKLVQDTHFNAECYICCGCPTKNQYVHYPCIFFLTLAWSVVCRNLANGLVVYGRLYCYARHLVHDNEKDYCSWHADTDLKNVQMSKALWAMLSVSLWWSGLRTYCVETITHPTMDLHWCWQIWVQAGFSELHFFSPMS